MEIRQSIDSGSTWTLKGTLRDPHGSALTAEYQCGYPVAVPNTDGLRVFFYSFVPGEGRYVAWNQLEWE
ncbi:hypothetical protein ACX9R5_17650 [Rathayibacter sp. CAU 1779]